MLICGVKVTHDGGVALIDGNRLVFATEVEKLDDNPRYSELGDAAVIARALATYGYAPGDVERFVVDGWGVESPVSRESQGNNRRVARLGFIDRGEGYALWAAPYQEHSAKEDVAQLVAFAGLRIDGREYD